MSSILQCDACSFSFTEPSVHEQSLVCGQGTLKYGSAHITHIPFRPLTLLIFSKCQHFLGAQLMQGNLGHLRKLLHTDLNKMQVIQDGQTHSWWTLQGSSFFKHIRNCWRGRLCRHLELFTATLWHTWHVNLSDFSSLSQPIILPEGSKGIDFVCLK